MPAVQGGETRWLAESVSRCKAAQPEHRAKCGCCNRNRWAWPQQSKRNNNQQPKGKASESRC